MENRYSGNCDTCGDPVDIGEGLVNKVDGDWAIRCVPCSDDDIPTVNITLHKNLALVQPAGYLGKEKFDAYCAACDDAGTKLSKAKGAKGNLAPFASVGRLIKELEVREFDVVVAGSVVAAMKKRAAQVENDVMSMAVTLDEIDERLAKRGEKLFKFQRDGVSWLAARRNAILADEMGLGKTVQALVSIPQDAPIIVVAPAIAKGVWLRECKRWRPDLIPIVLSGRKSFRWPGPGEMVITNYAILPNITGEKHDAKLRSALARSVPKGIVYIGDEAQALKNPKAQQSRRFSSLRAILESEGGRTWGLTATPLLNRPKELWSVLRAIDVAAEAFSTWQSFVDLHGGEKAAFGGIVFGKPSKIVAERLRRVMLRRERKDVLPDLPTKIWADLIVSGLNNEARKLCKSLLEKLKENGIDLNDAIAESDRTMIAKVAFEEISAVRAALATAKIPHMVKLVEQFEDAGVPVVVFSAHRAPIDIFKDRPGWGVITGDVSPAKRTEIEDAFQAGKLIGVAATIQAGGTAITLTRASQMVFVDRSWTPGLNSQAEDRCCRISQVDNVNITNLVLDHPIDLAVAELLKEKQILISATVERSTRTEVETDVKEAKAAAKAAAKRSDESESAPEPLSEPLAAPTSQTGRKPETPREEWAADALVYLQRMEDRTEGSGFEGRDRMSAGLMVRQLASEGLTGAQWRAAIRIAKRHWSRLGPVVGAV